MLMSTTMVGLGLIKPRLSAPNEGGRRTVSSFGSRLIVGIGDRCAPGSPFFAYFLWRSKESKSPSRIATV